MLTRPHDLPCGGGQVVVQWRKRRWRCRTTVCPQRTFTEQVAQVSAGMRTTTRLRTALAVAVEDGRDQSEVATAHQVSWPTVQRAVVTRLARLEKALWECNTQCLRPPSIGAARSCYTPGRDRSAHRTTCIVESDVGATVRDDN